MKPLFIISSAFDTYSGYGARSRDLIKAIIKTDKYNVRLLSQRWGATPFGFCNNNPEWKHLYDLVLPNNQIPKQPEIWMQITVPNEFQTVGKFNIGCTAGIESTICPPEWIEGINRMDLTLTSSEHSKKVFMHSTFEVRNKETNALEKNVKLEKPIEVLFEGANTDIYKVINTPCSLDIQIEEKFAYLFVGHWMAGDIGEDRKNVGLLIKAFYETFKNKSNKPALILKTSQVGSSYIDREEILKKIKQIRKTVNSTNLPNVYLLHGEFTDEEMNEIYNHSKVKAMVSLTKGEGFGRPLLEFTLSKKPLITSGWSGHVDFLDPEFSYLVEGELKNVHPSSVVPNMILAESQWFSPNHGEVGNAFRTVFENYKDAAVKGKRLGFKNRKEFSWDAMKNKMKIIFDEIDAKIPRAVALKLPQLRKIELPKLNKIEPQK
jgi:glycosyltransferase involved in cell wall biosynthesis